MKYVVWGVCDQIPCYLQTPDKYEWTTDSAEAFLFDDRETAQSFCRDEDFVEGIEDVEEFKKEGF